MSKIKKYKNVITIISVIILLLIIILIIKYIDASQETEIVNSKPLEIIEDEENTMQTEKMIIHITGEVKQEGIIEIEEGSRIADAIEKAGGLTEQADVSKVNLAYELEDGQKLYIPNINDEEIAEYVEEGVNENIIIEDTQNSLDGLININKAELEELQTLTGIGESIAESIITYREENGKFKKKEDIKNVSGIGESKYELIKDQIEV